MGVRILIFFWGLVEAMLFFVVPDVPLSFVAVDRTRNALIASLLALAGALVGGTAMYVWGNMSQASATAVLEHLPAIDRAMIDRVERDLETDGIVTMFVGSFTGTPYKIYAAQSAAVEIPLLRFLLASVPARLLRFVLVSSIVGWISTRLLPAWPRRRKMLALGGFWVLFYAAFFTLMP